MFIISKEVNSEEHLQRLASIYKSLDQDFSSLIQTISLAQFQILSKGKCEIFPYNCRNQVQEHIYLSQATN